MGEAILIGLILLAAAALFEAAWRLAVAALVFGPPAFAGIAVVWFATKSEISVWIALAFAVVAFLIVRQAMFLLLSIVIRRSAALFPVA